MDTVTEIEQLRAENERTSQWYAVRWQRLRELVRGTELENKACAIMANGTATPSEIPNYDLLVNQLRAERDALAADNAALREALGYYADDHTWGVRRTVWVRPPIYQDGGRRASEALENDSPGAALLAELEALRKLEKQLLEMHGSGRVRGTPSDCGTCVALQAVREARGEA